MNILITGFGPFDRFSFNPAQVVAKALEEENGDVTSRILPVVFGDARKAMQDILHDTVPDIVISFGLNATIGHIALEEIAVNIASSEIPDNSGNTPLDQVLADDGPLSYRSTLPLRRMLDELRRNDIPAALSYSAGVYICNEVFYTLMEYCDRTGARGGFIHIPMATEMIATDVKMYKVPHMSMDTLKRACRIVLETSI